MIAAEDEPAAMSTKGTTNLTGSGSRAPACLGVTLNDTGLDLRKPANAAQIPSATNGHLVRLYSQFSQLTSGAQDGRERESRRRRADEQEVVRERVEEPEPEYPRQPPQVPRRQPEQDRRQAARPLELLDGHGRERVGPVTVRLGVDGERAVPSGRVQQERGREVLGEIRPDAADLAERLGAHRVVRADAQRREPA